MSRDAWALPRVRARAAACCLALLLSACVTQSGPAAEEPVPEPVSGTVSPQTGAPREGPTVTAPAVAPSGPFPVAQVTLEPSGGGTPVTVAVHVAADPDTRARGLMHREEVAPGTGMLFLFPRDGSGGFWMKDTLVPLSIAFVDAGGSVLRIIDMDPCDADPCESYDPGVTYRMALEVPQGDFDRLGVGEGDTLSIQGAVPPAR